MWLFISVPLMVLATAIAVVPVALGSVRFHRAEHGRKPVVNMTARSRSLRPAAVAFRAVSCPLCATNMYATSDDGLVYEVQRHAWQRHGIPSPPVILESASTA